MIKIPKVEGTLKCEQHRTISVINHITKIIVKVITEKIRIIVLPIKLSVLVFDSVS